MTKPLDLSAAAAALGRKGGQSTSERKAAASRANGKRGGRPRKSQGKTEMNDKRKCPNCKSTDITVKTPPSARGTDFWDYAECNNCGYPKFSNPPKK